MALRDGLNRIQYTKESVRVTVVPEYSSNNWSAPCSVLRTRSINNEGAITGGRSTAVFAGRRPYILAHCVRTPPESISAYIHHCHEDVRRVSELLATTRGVKTRLLCNRTSLVRLSEKQRSSSQRLQYRDHDHRQNTQLY